MSNNDKDKPSTPPAIAPLSYEIGRDWKPVTESYDIRKSYDRVQNTVRNSSAPVPNPNRDNGGGNKDTQ